jgi:multisubunit Na+/H+ antiporter MnhB subunit
MKGNDNSGTKRRNTFTSLFIVFLLGIFFAALVWAYLGPVSQSVGLAHTVENTLFESGVESRVTAVLLNFRAYDTLLECFVLFLGVVAVWSLRPSRSERLEPEVGPILSSLVRLLIPLMVLVGGYLLWAGSNQAGGAFQAGAIIGGAGVLFLLTSPPLMARLPRGLFSGGICLGPFFFLLIGVIALAMGGDFLEYRLESATRAIVILESAAAFSIGLSLAALFSGRRPEKHEKVAKGGGK